MRPPQRDCIEDRMADTQQHVREDLETATMGVDSHVGLDQPVKFLEQVDGSSVSSSRRRPSTSPMKFLEHIDGLQCCPAGDDGHHLSAGIIM